MKHSLLAHVLVSAVHSLEWHWFYKLLFSVFRAIERLNVSDASETVGQHLEGLWHTAIVVHGKEYFFGSGGIQAASPVRTWMSPNCSSKHNSNIRMSISAAIRAHRFLIIHSCGNMKIRAQLQLVSLIKFWSLEPLRSQTGCFCSTSKRCQIDLQARFVN
jgi:hypothetical protein